MHVFRYIPPPSYKSWFDFTSPPVFQFLENLIASSADNAPLQRLYQHLLTTLEEASRTSPIYITEFDSQSHIGAWAGELLQQVRHTAYCPDCQEVYPSDQLRLGRLVDPADPYGYHNGLLVWCPQQHELAFVSDLIVPPSNSV